MVSFECVRFERAVKLVLHKIGSSILPEGCGVHPYSQGIFYMIDKRPEHAPWTGLFPPRVMLDTDRLIKQGRR